ncbi:uncharacterized protein LOC128217629 isoform X2 [Mya arenaria]|nr:uncharacterized protein LOC128217629 isoform X2 [Mya arenaria]
MLAMAMDWFLEGKLSVYHALLVCTACMCIAALASFVLGRSKKVPKINFDSPESRNWLKQWKAVFITRRALLPFVKLEAKRVHSVILQKASNIQTCLFDHGPVHNNSSMQCNFHKTLRDEILAQHEKKKPSWKNSSTDTWQDSPFAVAKLFMQSPGYDDKSSFDEIDFNGLAVYMFNCKEFTQQPSQTLKTLSDKARENVNKIRHMPDVCSSALTDQATTEFIDSMIAVLNDPYIQGKPEMIKARKRLDELKLQTQDPNLDLLKYIIEDSAIRSVQTITELASAQEGEWSEQANKIKDDIEKLGGIVISNLGKEGESAINDIKNTLGNALANVDDCIDKAKKIIIEAASEEKQKFKKTCESETKKIIKTLADEQNKLKTEEKEQRDSAKAKSDLQKQLINHYQATSVRINLRLDIDAAVEDIYEQPKLILKDKDGNITDDKISEINQMFLSDNGTMVKTIFVEGEPGSGKTSLCKRIVHGWCKLKQDGNEEKKEEYPLSQFEFLFYVRLRDVEDQCKIKEIIFRCLIEQIHSVDEESKELLSDILRFEHCLILLDGLDEFEHCSRCKRVDRIPHIESSWINCTTVITTRPYKLAELKLTRSQIGKHVELQGVQSPEELVLKITKELEKYQVEKRPDNCVQELKNKGLWRFRGNIMVLVHIVWLWFRNRLMEEMPLFVVLGEIIQERWYEMCEKKNIDANELPDEFLSSVSELAFSTFFSYSEDDSNVFGINWGQLKKLNKYKQAFLETGIISCSQRTGSRLVSYQFLFKTLQEYLAALYLAKYTSDLSNDLQHIQKVYIDSRRESVLSLGQMFLFLCGLSITSANEFSNTLNDLFTASCERDGYSPRHVGAFQNMIHHGYVEAEKSGETGMTLCLQHIVLDEVPVIKHSLLKQCLDERKSTIVSLSIRKKSDLCSYLQYKDDPTVLDLGACKNLKFVAFENISYNDIFKPNWNGLLECKIEFSEYKPANKLVSSFLSSDLTCLKTLKLDKIGWECKAEEIVSKIKNIKELDLQWNEESPLNDSQFDLGHLEHLHQLSLWNFAFSDVINLRSPNFNKLTVKFRSPQRAPHLMAALLAPSDGTNLDRPLSFLTDVHLRNILMSAGKFRRLVWMVIQSGHYVDCVVDLCTIEPEEDLRQLEVEKEPNRQMVAPQPASTDGTPQITLNMMSMSAGEFRHLVWMVIHAKHSVNLVIDECTIEPEMEVIHLEVDNENQSALKMMALQAAQTEYNTHITLYKITISAVEFRHLVRMVIQPGHSVNCELDHCTIKLGEEVKHLEVENENQPALQMVAFQNASTDYTTHITLNQISMAAVEFRHVVWMVKHAGHSVECVLDNCTIETEVDVRQQRVENEPARQMVAPQPSSTNYLTYIKINEGTMSAETFRNLIMVIQSGYSVNCMFSKCTIRPWENVRRLQLQMENPPAFQMATPQPVSPGYTKRIIALHSVTMSARVFRHLVSMVIHWKQSVDLNLSYCTIEPEGNVSQHQAALEKLENLLAVKMGAAQPVSTDYTTRIIFESISISPGVFGRLVTLMMNSGHSVKCNINDCMITKHSENEMQLQGQMENQPELHMVDQQPDVTDYAKHIALNEVRMQSETFRYFLSLVIKSHYLIECESILDQSLQFKQLMVDIRNRPAVEMVAPQPAITDYTTHITMNKGTIGAELFRLLVTMVIQTQCDVDCKLDSFTIESGLNPRMLQKQPDHQTVAQQSLSPNFTKHIQLTLVTMSNGVFRRLVGLVKQSGYSVNCRFNRCIIERDEEEEEVMKLLKKMESQPALEMVAHHPASTYLTTDISLDGMSISLGELRRLVNLLIQSGQSVDLKLESCSIYSEAKQQLEEIENQPVFQSVVQPALFDHTTHITFKFVTMSARVFSPLVSMVIQSQHSVDFKLEYCTIGPESDTKELEVQIENQSAFKMMNPLPASPGHTAKITLKLVTISTKVFTRLVRMVIKSGHSVNCKLDFCTIGPDQALELLQVESENQTVIQMLAPQSASTDYTTHIALDSMSLSAEAFVLLFTMVIHSGHVVNCELRSCVILPEKEVSPLQEEMDTQPAPHPASTLFTTHITIHEGTLSARTFTRLVTILKQSQHSVDCELQKCTIEPLEDVKQLGKKMAKQSNPKVTEFSKPTNDHRWCIKFNIQV